MERALPVFSVRMFLILGIGVVVSALAATVMAGWFTRSVFLTQVSPTFTPMQFNAALLFLLASIGLIAAALHRLHVALGLGTVVAAVALLTMGQYLFGFDLGIDTLFAEPFTSVKTPHVGRMAPNTATCFLLVGGALILFGRWRRGGGQLIGAGTLGSIVLGVGLVVIAGYFSGVEAAYRWGRLTAMAAHAAVGFVLLGAGILMFSWWESRKSGDSMPRWYTIPVGIGFLTLAVVMWQALEAQDYRVADRILAGEADNLRIEIKGNVEHQLFALGRMAARWEAQGGTPRPQWELDAKSYIGDLPGLLNLAVVGPGFRPSWVFPKRFEDRDLHRAVDDFARKLSQGSNAGIFRLGRIRISKPFALPVLGTVFLAGSPLSVDNKAGGVLVGSFSLASTFYHLNMEQKRKGYGFSIHQEDRLLVSTPVDNARPSDRWLKETTIRIGDMVWGLRVWPRPEKLETLRSPASTLVLVIGFVLAGLGILTVRTARNARLQTRSAERAKERLEREVESRKRAEEELRTFQQHLKLILDSAGEGIWGLDYIHGRISFANPAAERMLGWRAEELEDRGHHDLFHHTRLDGSPYPREECSIYKTFKTGEVHHVDDEIFWRKDGTGISVAYTSSPTRDEEGNPAGAVVIFRDITERKRQEEKIYRANAELAAANKELEAFSYSVSHDLRAPLRALDGFSHALVEDYEGALDERAKEYLQRIRKATRRMGTLIDDLLGLSRLTRKELTIEDTDLSVIAHSVVEDLRRADPDRSAELLIKDGLMVRADEELMRIALQNLLGNAWKYTGKREDARIEFGEFTDKEGQSVYFVRDNGTGFDMAYADKLFTPFQRLHGRDEFDGTGIGLATVQRILHRHGGRIWMDAAPGQGATFYFTLLRGETMNVEGENDDSER